MRRIHAFFWLPRSVVKSVRYIQGIAIDETNEVKKKLKQLYRKIHPDLFHASPEKRVRHTYPHTWELYLFWYSFETSSANPEILLQKTNEESFKVLQQYLKIAESDGRDTSSANQSYKIRFFLKSSLIEDAVDVTLPPLVRMYWKFEE